MTLNKEETAALKAYFDQTIINITILIKKMGLKQVKEFQQAIDKIYKEDEKDNNS